MFWWDSKALEKRYLSVTALRGGGLARVLFYFQTTSKKLKYSLTINDFWLRATPQGYLKAKTKELICSCTTEWQVHFHLNAL